MRVVLLHGLTNSKRAFDRLLPLLDDFDVTALDLPGHGAKATQPFMATIAGMAAAMTPEIPGPCLVLGHSLGGVVATAIAGRRPDLVTHLVVVDSPPVAASRVAAKGRECVLRRPVLGPLLWRTMSRRTVRNGLRTAFAPGFDFPQFFVDDFRLLRWRTFAGAMNSIDGFIAEKSLYDRVDGIAAPTTIVFGEKEQRIDPAAFEGYSSTGADVVAIAEAGLTPTWETPERVADALRRCASLSGPR
ncbi:alpha/beta hydrolase [Mycobacterium sp.]|uniref:alpha/beta fold hydrolase n=1 Tax=Mycobacterium sp. TaxID=1785 RepID=UPI002CCAA046|nr:alpha/beta hydrolase [Mycobacterium sp.]HME46667.1 alpha/beta hydrolase [Mycobacterium sp.]